MSVVAKVSYFWRSAAHGMRHGPFVHVIAVTTVALALFSLGLARGALSFVDALLATVGGEVEMTVHLADGTTDETAAELARALASSTGGTSRIVPPAEALERLEADLGDLGGVLSAMPENPLPKSIEVTLPPEGQNPVALKELAEQVAKLEAVTGVDYGQEAVERLSAIARALRVGSMLLFAVVVLTTVVVVSATLQLAIYARREEIEIQKLVGATDRFVKMPFLIEGLIQGLLGATVAALALHAFSTFAGPTLEEAFGFLRLPSSLALLDWRRLLELVAVGCGLGLLGSLLAVRRFLRV